MNDALDAQAEEASLARYGAMGQSMVAITAQDCTGCDLCILHCPFEALLPLLDCPAEFKRRPIVVLEQNCVGCLSCIGSCPTDALFEVSVPAAAEFSALLQDHTSSPECELIDRWSAKGTAVV